MPLDVAYSPFLVLCSLAVAIMASFTALRLTSNLRALSAPRRKVRVSQAALALGTGIWSMHFIGMLAVTLPILISYNPVSTLSSALIAVLVVGMAFLSLHFGLRTKTRMYVAGTLTGLGIVGMHYLGMSAISANCVVSHSPLGVVLAIAIAIATSIAAIELAYRKRSLLGVAAGSVVLGLAISAMHYTAMFFTIFSLGAEIAPAATPLLKTDQLALVVTLSSFVVCGLFLLMAVPDETASGTDKAVAAPASGNDFQGASAPAAVAPTMPRQAAAPADNGGGESTIPYQREKATRFLPSSDVHVIKADGHYTRITNGEEEMFCPWSISRVEKSLDPDHFVRTHRSFIVNKDRISGFRRDGDKAFCIMSGNNETEIPVSRSRIPLLREALQMD